VRSSGGVKRKSGTGNQGIKLFSLSEILMNEIKKSLRIMVKCITAKFAEEGAEESKD
jgi:hypothetical protein